MPSRVRLLVPMLLFAAAATASTDEVAGLLDLAETALREGHTIYPVSGSAMALYQRALALDPENEDAALGLTRLAEDYLEEAQAALERRDLISAGAALSQARMVYPDYEGLEPIERQLALLERRKHYRETLDWRLVAEQSVALEPTLVKLGALAKADDCRVTIDVSNDREGRWVFQAMNKAPGAARLRADVRIASPAAVEVECFEPT